MQDQIETFGMLLIKGVIAPALAALLAWAMAHAGAWIKAHVSNEKASGALERLAQLAFSVVQEVQQTVVSSLPDKANKDALRAARDQAIATLKSHLGEKGLRELMAALGLDSQAVERLLTTYVESSVHMLKEQSNPTTTTTTVTKVASGLDAAGNPTEFKDKTVTVTTPGATT